MKRFFRFWAIRLLGREFMAQSTGEIFVGSWLILSVIKTLINLKPERIMKVKLIYEVIAESEELSHRLIALGEPARIEEVEE